MTKVIKKIGRTQDRRLFLDELLILDQIDALTYTQRRGNVWQQAEHNSEIKARISQLEQDLRSLHGRDSSIVSSILGFWRTVLPNGKILSEKLSSKKPMEVC